MKWQAAPGELEVAYRALSAVLVGTDFYLAGGTALALQMGHRISVDLDLMSPSFEDPEKAIQDLRDGGLEFETTLVAPGTLYIDLAGVQASLFSYRYPLLSPLIQSPDDLLPLAHSDDIAAMKLAAITSRGSRKDFVDLWFLVHQSPPLQRSLDLFRRKYDSRDVGHVVRSLTYFDDADAEPALRMLIEAPWEQVKRDFLRWVDRLLAD